MSAVSGEYWIKDGCDSEFADGDMGEYNHEMIAFSAGLGHLDEDEYGQLANPAVGFDWDGLAQKFIEENDIDYSVDEIQKMTPEQWQELGESAGVDPETIKQYLNNPKDREVALGYQQLMNAGASAEFISWWENEKAPDARVYGVGVLGWIRVKGDNYQMRKFDDAALECIKNFDGLNEILEDDENAFEEGGEYADEEAFIEEIETGKSWSIPYRDILKAQSAAGLIRYKEGIGKYR